MKRRNSGLNLRNFIFIGLVLSTPVLLAPPKASGIASIDDLKGAECRVQELSKNINGLKKRMGTQAKAAVDTQEIIFKLGSKIDKIQSGIKEARDNEILWAARLKDIREKLDKAVNPKRIDALLLEEAEAMDNLRRCWSKR